MGYRLAGRSAALEKLSRRLSTCGHDRVDLSKNPGFAVIDPSVRCMGNSGREPRAYPQSRLTICRSLRNQEREYRRCLFWYGGPKPLHTRYCCHRAARLLCRMNADCNGRSTFWSPSLDCGPLGLSRGMTNVHNIKQSPLLLRSGQTPTSLHQYRRERPS